MTYRELKRFRDAHPVGGWCRTPRRNITKSCVLKLGRLDVPPAVDNRDYCTPVEDQGANPWCAAYTAAAFAENVLWRRDGVIKQVEPEPVYRWAKAHDGDPDGAGTTLNAALSALLAKGVFDKEKCKVRMVGYGWIGTNENDVKAAVHRFGCFLGGFNITDEWYTLAGVKRCNIIGRDGESYGGHAVLVCGYNADGVWIENSWGRGWGDGGFGFIEWGAFRKQFMYGAVLTHCLDGFR